mgnify:CR=1 FL=1
MAGQSIPKLSDGTSLSDLINLDTREVKMRTLSDPELFELEMEKIFAKTWVFLGHETEIPKKGDFVVRDMGSDSVLMARGADGERARPRHGRHGRHGRRGRRGDTGAGGRGRAHAEDADRRADRQGPDAPGGRAPRHARRMVRRAPGRRPAAPSACRRGTRT